MPDKLLKYLDAAMAQIRWKRARPALRAELQAHLLCQAEDCRAAGMTEEEAAAEAVRQMGDPAEAGAALNQLHRPASQWGLLSLTLALAITGGFLRVWLTAGWNQGKNIDPVTAALAVCLGAACLLGGYFLDYRFLCRHGKAVYLCTVLLTLCALALSPKVQGVSYYARYVVLVYPLIYALWLCAWQGRSWDGLAAALLGGVPLTVLAMCAPSVQGILTLLTVGFVLLMLAIRWNWFAVPKGPAQGLVCGIALLLAGGVVARMGTGYGQHRLLMLLHPEQDPLAGGYQALMVRRALAGAQWLGEGTMAAPYSGIPYEQIVPEAKGDFLLTTLIYKLGWLPFLLLLAATALLLAGLLWQSRRLKDPMGRIAALAVALSLGLQAAEAVVLNLGLILFSVHFPLLMGNLYTILDMALVGLALSVFREARLPAWQCRPSPVAPAEMVQVKSE